MYRLALDPHGARGRGLKLISQSPGNNKIILYLDTVDWGGGITLGQPSPQTLRLGAKTRRELLSAHSRIRRQLTRGGARKPIRRVSARSLIVRNYGHQ